MSIDEDFEINRVRPIFILLTGDNSYRRDINGKAQNIRKRCTT